MDNKTRRALLTRQKSSGFPGSILDVFQAFKAGRDIIGEYEQQQQQIQVPNTPEEREQGLRAEHAAGNTQASMAFPDVPADQSFNTVGMKAPIDIKKVDNQGHLVKSYENVPPGVQNLPMGAKEGMVIETPANMQSGGEVKKYQDGGATKETLAKVFPEKYPDTTARDLRGTEIPSFMQAQYPTPTTSPIEAPLSAEALERYMAKKKGGTPASWKAVADTIGFHESGPWARNDPKAKQRGGGPGRGLYQFETTHSKSFATAQQRHRNLARLMSMPVDSAILKAKSADELTADQQRTLFQGNLLEGPAKLKDYVSGDLTTEDLWLKGHKRKEAKGDRKAFRASVKAMKKK
jgi:uncharacterized membrane protein (UPF0127 family)